MNVLHVGIGNLFGGVETFLVSLGRRRDLWGPVQHQFALCVEGRFSRELAEHDVPVTFLGETRVSRPWTVLRARRRLAELLREKPGFDVVICHASWPQAVFGPVVRAAGLPLVFYLHGPTGGGHWTDRWAARTPPDLMIGVSRHTVETGRLIFPTCPAEVLNYPIPWPDAVIDDPSIRAEVRKELGASPDEVIIIQASRMEPWKGTDQHLRALALIKDLPGWTCWIAGGSQRPYERRYREELDRLADELGVDDRVKFLGERRDVPRLLAAADILCQANRGPEGFSLAFMEAFNAGLPIVTTALGGAPELIDETSGVLAAPGDIAAVADGLRRLILDPELRRRMGAAARRRVWETSDPATQFGKLADLLASVAPRALAG